MVESYNSTLILGITFAPIVDGKSIEGFNMNKWNHVISQVDNWIWVGVAIAVYIVAKIFDIPTLNAVAGACLVKIKQNGNKNP